jgi:PAS domain S-box-containing protein
MLTSLQPIWIGWGKDLTYFYNDPYKAIIGGRHPWALGQPTREVWGEIWHEIGPMLDTALGGDKGTFVESQLLIMERNGYPEETYYTFSYSPIPNDHGTVGGIICANSDDTQRVIGERQLALLRDLASDASHARSWFEACGRSLEALKKSQRDLPFAMIYMAEPNASAAKLAGTSGIDRAHDAVPESISLDSAAPWPIGEVLRSQTLKLIPDLSSVLDGDIPTGPWSHPPKQAALVPIPPTGENGRSGVLVVGLSPVRVFDDNYRSFLGLVAGQIAAAITNAQTYEEERRRAEALAELDRAKTAFFSNVSHEFRTPLTLMLGPLEDALNDFSSTELPPVQRGRLETAHRNSIRLLKLVNSLLDFSRIEAGRVDVCFEPVDLEKLTAELVSNFQSAIEKAGLRLRTDFSPLHRSVYVDRDMWEKIVLNLLSNAFKFTFEGEIEVELRSARGRQFAELIVRDTGVGVPKSELPRLFERFHRIENQRSRSFEGSGIGLALVQELVKLHGGTILAESELNKGTAFTISIPFGLAHLPAEHIGKMRSRASTSLHADAYVEEALRWLPEVDESSVASSRADDDTLFEPPPTGARILVADDNVDMRRYVRRLLGSRWQVDTVSNGLDALEAIRSKKPDLVLTDVMMPRLDGFGLLHQIRSDQELRDIPVIVLSAKVGEEARVQGLDAGADDYLTKPFSARELIARVNTNLEMSRLRQEATRELRESEARFRNMAEHAPVMMWMTDSTGALTYLNRLWSEFTGQSAKDALGFGAWDALHPDDQVRSQRIFLDANAAHEPFRIEYRLRHKDGTYRWALSAAGPRFDHNHEFLGYIGSVIDISDRKEAEQILEHPNELLEQRVNAVIAERTEAESQLRQSQKMEAVGKLTGGVAHDFNNVLQVIGGNLQLLSRDIAGNLRAEQRLQTAMMIAVTDTGCGIAPEIIDQVFEPFFTTKPEGHGTGLGLSMVYGFVKQSGGHIKIYSESDQGTTVRIYLPRTRDMEDIETDVEAGPATGGSETVLVVEDDEDVRITVVDMLSELGYRVLKAKDAQSALAIVESGVPIDCLFTDVVMPGPLRSPELARKAQERLPNIAVLFTSGYTENAIVHGGKIDDGIELLSKPYTREALARKIRYVLRNQQQRSVALSPSSRLSQRLRGSNSILPRPLRVLLVEDDPIIRSSTAEMLADLGHSVTEAGDGEEALEFLDNGVFDVLVTDLALPRMSGEEVASRAVERSPGLRVVFATGYERPKKPETT